jgi:hypothetical protein
MQDIALGGEEVRIGNKRLCLHTLSDTDDLPVSAETRYENCLPIEVTVFCLCCTSWIVVKLQSHLQPIFFLDNSEDKRKFENQQEICIPWHGIVEPIKSIRNGSNVI